jgi:hypothetical protein
MAIHHDELLEVAERLLVRSEGERGRLSRARVRRSISTAYYALFHFLLREIGRSVVGKEGKSLRRRRILARTISHKGVRTALDKVRGNTVDKTVADFLGAPGSASGTVATPHFVAELAKVFIDAQDKRHEADYNLNEWLAEADAKLLSNRVRASMAAWQAANAKHDRDFKHALSILILLKGQLRTDP